MPLILPATIQNPSPGATLLSTWGDGVNAAVDYLGSGKPRARVFNSANISIANATLQQVTFDSERYDVGGCHSTVTNTGRLTVPAGEGGLYTGGVAGRFLENVTGRRALLVRLNGITTIAQSEHAPNATSGESMHVFPFEYQLAAGDWLELVAFQTSGAALNLLAGAAYTPEFWFRWVAATA